MLSVCTAEATLSRLFYNHPPPFLATIVIKVTQGMASFPIFLRYIPKCTRGYRTVYSVVSRNIQELLTFYGIVNCKGRGARDDVKSVCKPRATLKNHKTLRLISKRKTLDLTKYI